MVFLATFLALLGTVALWSSIHVQCSWLVYFSLVPLRSDGRFEPSTNLLRCTMACKNIPYPETERAGVFGNVEASLEFAFWMVSSCRVRSYGRRKIEWQTLRVWVRVDTVSVCCPGELIRRSPTEECFSGMSFPPKDGEEDFCDEAPLMCRIVLLQSTYHLFHYTIGLMKIHRL
jgi:hypothetical protein